MNQPKDSPGRKGITFDDVATAAEALQSAGKRPTAHAVRVQLGQTGSYGTIGRHLATWKETTKGSNYDQAVTPTLVAAIHSEVAVRLKDVLADLEAAREDIDDLTKECDQLASQNGALQATIEEARAANHTLQGQIEAMSNELQNAKAEWADAMKKAKEEIEMTRAEAETARTERAKAELRLEALPSIQAEIIRLRQENAGERATRVEAEQRAATMEVRCESLEEKLRDQAHAYGERIREMQKVKESIESRLSESQAAWQKERDTHVVIVTDLLKKVGMPKHRNPTEASVKRKAPQG